MIDSLRIARSQEFHPWNNQALEAYFLDNLTDNELILYLWQNDHTVVIGRNQDAAKECRYQELEADGGYLARRTSGGGAVYHDKANLNFTFLTKKQNYDVAKQLSVIQEALHMVGLTAELSGRNDLTIDGAKFSGNAFYQAGDNCYHHGTILLNVDTEKMARYLMPSKKKLASKGVSSVQSRVVNLKSLVPELDIERLVELLVCASEKIYGLKSQAIVLDELDAKALAYFQSYFAEDSWRYGKSERFDLSFSERFSWGEIELRASKDGNALYDFSIVSDALSLEALELLLQELKQMKLSPEELKLNCLKLAQRYPGYTEVYQDIASMIQAQGLQA